MSGTMEISERICRGMEKIGMTILGQMLFEDGEKKGMERGEEQGIQRQDV